MIEDILFMDFEDAIDDASDVSSRELELAERLHGRRASRATRLRTNKRYDRPVVVTRNPRVKNEDAPGSHLRRVYRGSGKQERILGFRMVNVQPRLFMATYAAEVKFKDVQFPTRITRSLADRMLVPDHKAGTYHEETQPFLYLLQNMPREVLDFFVEKGILITGSKEEWVLDRIDKQGSYVSMNKYDGLQLWGYRTEPSFWRDIRWEDQPFMMDQNMCETLYRMTEDHPDARKRLRMFGLYEPTSLERVVQVTKPVKSLFGVKAKDVTAAHLRMYNRHRNRIQGPKTKLGRSDLRTNAHRGPCGKTKGPYNMGERAFITRILSSQTEPEESGRTSPTRRKKGRTRIKNYRRKGKSAYTYAQLVIDNPGKLVYACSQIATGEAKCDYFSSPDPLTNGVISIILKYIQSRTDKKKRVDFDQILALENPVVDFRIRTTWEQQSGVGLISIPYLFGRRFYDTPRDELEQPGSEGRMVYLGDSSEIFLPLRGSYYRNPANHIVDVAGLLREVRRVLNGQQDVGEYPHLDPRTATILQFAQDARVFSNGRGHPYQPDDIAHARVPQLRYLLRQRDLLDARVTLDYGKRYDPQRRKPQMFRRPASAF